MRAWLHERLPDYMVPGVLTFLDKLPLTPNGKVDRKRLPAPEDRAQDKSAAVLPPRTRMEERIAAIWSDVLQTEVRGVRDNFFDLGGHSLLLIRVHSRLRQEFDADISVIDLFRHTTIEDLAGHLGRRIPSTLAGEVNA
jgi:acyl carrier protein